MFYNKLKTIYMSMFRLFVNNSQPTKLCTLYKNHAGCEGWNLELGIPITYQWI